LAKAQDALDKDFAALAAKTNEILAKVAEHYEEVARENVQSLLISAGDQITKVMEARAAELSSAFSTRLEGRTRSYFEHIAKSIAEIPRDTSSHSTD
jgi:predicted small metal-binding protein